jgi:FkbM family methyltransferase
MTFRRWTIAGLSFTLPKPMVTPGIARMCDNGWYEGEERRALKAHLNSQDRVLEIGGGAGFITCVAAQMVGPESVTTVEANSNMLSVIRANLTANSFEGVTLRHGAVLAQAAPGTKANLHVPEAFWAASVTNSASGKTLTCPAIGFDRLVDDRIRPA